MINWIEKGEGLIKALEVAGFHKVMQDGTVRVFPEDREIEAQAIIDAYDELADLKAGKIKDLHAERTKRAAAILDPEQWMLEAFNAIFIHQKISKGQSTPRQDTKLAALETKAAPILANAEAAEDAEIVINGYTTVDEINNYDVVNTPIWSA